MAFNGSGTFLRLYNWVTDRNNSVKINAERMDAEFDGIATALSNTLCRDGQSTVSANIPFNSKKITGLGDATADTDALNRQTADARFIKKVSTLTEETSLADTDLMVIGDSTDSIDKRILWSNVKSELVAELRGAGTIFSPTNTILAFMAAAPTGWTKITTHNNKALRVVSGTGAGSGGSDSFTATFADRTLVRANLPNITITGNTGTGGSHAHNITINTYNAISGSGPHTVLVGPAFALANGTITETTDTESAHLHSFAFDLNGGVTQTTIPMALQYIDVIIIEKS